MKQLRSHIALLCVVLTATPMFAQNTTQNNKPESTQPRLDSESPHWYSTFTQRYQSKIVPPINISNSGRIDQLLRSGNLYLSLQDAIALALENNIDIEVQRYQYQLSDTALFKARATGGAQTGPPLYNLDPVVGGTVNFGHTTQPSANAITSAGAVSTSNNNRLGNFNVSQGFLTGTQATFGYNNTNTSSSNPGNTFNPSTTSNLDLQITQHLLQGFGLALNNRGLRVAKNNLRVTDYGFQQQVITTVSNTITLYWNLVSAIENVKVQQQAVELAQKLYEDNKKQLEIGTMAVLDVTNAEAQVATSTYTLVNSKSQVELQEVNLKNAISRNGLAYPLIADAHIVPTDAIRIPDVEPVQPVQDLVATALDKRPDIQQSRIQLDNSQINLAGTRSSMLPVLDLVGDLRNNALSGSLNNQNTRNSTCFVNPSASGCPDPFFVGGYGNVLSQLLAGLHFPNYSIGVTLSIPLRNRSAQADMATAQINLRTQELALQKLQNQVRADIQTALISVRNARASYESATKSSYLQQQTLEAEQKKLNLGTSIPYNVILKQRDLSNAQQNEVAARTAYGLAKVSLDTATGMTLDHNNIAVDEARTGKVSRPPSSIPAR